MAPTYSMQDIDDVVRARRHEAQNWGEATLYSVVESVQDYARAKPLSFGLWSFGIGFVLGWKLKIW